MERPERFRVGVVGAGRVGSVLGAALARAGHQVVAASGVSEESVRRAERLLPGTPLLPVDEVVADAELVLLAVPDDELTKLVAGLGATGQWGPGQLVLHTSGAHGLAPLKPAADAGVLPMAVHPVMTFAGRDEDVDRLAGIPFGVTAPEQLMPVAEVLVLEMGGEPVRIADELRPLYHAALAIGANHLVTLVADAAQMLRTAGVERPDQLLGPLLGAALDNGLRLGDAGLTGPVVRGDAETVRTHVETVARHQPESLTSYVAMARRTASRALSSGRLRPRDAEDLLDALSGDTDKPTD